MQATPNQQLNCAYFQRNANGSWTQRSPVTVNGQTLDTPGVRIIIRALSLAELISERPSTGSARRLWTARESANGNNDRAWEDAPGRHALGICLWAGAIYARTSE
jgi:hypothetical protein